MAIDTLTKRSAALRYGRGRTRQPEASSTAFVRGAGVGCWYQVPVVVVDDEGFTAIAMPARSRLIKAQRRSRLIQMQQRSRTIQKARK